ASKINENIGVYFVGEAPTNEYIQLVDKQGAKNVHFLGFKSKTELAEYYQMSDIFVLLTRYDIWGLVINEAMANGLPIITTTNCVAGKELVKDDINGYLISPESEEQFINIVNDLIHNEDKIHSMGYSALDTIKNYTIEKMTDAHVEIFNKII
ncbi:MAG: hypothetical protein PWR27_2468, partial [Petroclostridium sp.]|nr:hypothetical protein [Petroclostridium sp.]